MPKKLEDCVEQVKAKQGKKVNAYAVCNAAISDAKKCNKDMKKALVDSLSEAYANEPFNEEELKMEIKKALTSTSGTGTNPDPVTPNTEVPAGTVEAAPAAAATTETPAAAAPAADAPKLAAGLFQGFTLGATLKQGPTGNVMSNLKKPMMDYEKQYQGSTKNQKLSPQELAQIKPETPKK